MLPQGHLIGPHLPGFFSLQMLTKVDQMGCISCWHCHLCSEGCIARITDRSTQSQLEVALSGYQTQMQGCTAAPMTVRSPASHSCVPNRNTEHPLSLFSSCHAGSTTRKGERSARNCLRVCEAISAHDVLMVDSMLPNPTAPMHYRAVKLGLGFSTRSSTLCLSCSRSP